MRRDDGAALLRWHRLETLWEAVRALSKADRPGFLDREIPDDPALRTELEELLTAADRAADFFDRLNPIVGRGADHALERRLLEETTIGLAGRYELDRELGRGGTATVFLARDCTCDRSVAIKVLHPRLAAAIGFRRFEREIRVAARLAHPHILPLLDSGEVTGGCSVPRMWYTMPYVSGGSLRRRLSETTITWQEAVAITTAVAGALDYAHSEGFVHRDVKPENILLQDGCALLADFGIARALDTSAYWRLTGTGFTPGTPSYMSPEQSAGSELDGRSDLFSLACVACEMLTGRPPIRSTTEAGVRIGEIIAGIGALRSTEVKSVLARGLALAAGDRFATGHDFADALDAAGVQR